MEAKHGDTVYVGPEPHKAARPMKVVVADNGCTWLCDASVDETRDLEEQGCWRCAEVPFSLNTCWLSATADSPSARTDPWIPKGRTKWRPRNSRVTTFSASCNPSR